MHGIAHYARSRSPINMKPTGRVAGIQMQPPWAGEACASTLKHALSALQTCHKLGPRGPQRRVDHSMMLKSSSSSATEPNSGAILDSPKRKTRADRSCGPRDMISGLSGAYGDAHGGSRHVG